MARLDLSFHSGSRLLGGARLDRLGVALLLAGALALAWATAQWLAARDSEVKLTSAIRQLQQRSAPVHPASRADAAAQATRDRIAAQLNAGWQPAFNALAATRSSKIALLSLDAVHAKRQIKLVAEARHLADAVAFVEALHQQPDILHAALIQYEIQADADQKPVRFHVTVEWRG